MTITAPAPLGFLVRDRSVRCEAPSEALKALFSMPDAANQRRRISNISSVDAFPRTSSSVWDAEERVVTGS